MAAQGSLTPSDYIAHHLTNLTVKVGEGGFWTLNLDTIVMSWVLARYSSAEDCADSTQHSSILD